MPVPSSRPFDHGMPRRQHASCSQIKGPCKERGHLMEENPAHRNPMLSRSRSLPPQLRMSIPVARLRSLSSVRRPQPPLRGPSRPRHRSSVWLLVPSSVAGSLGHSVARGDALERIRSSGRLRYGSDMEGGGPYAYPDPSSPRDVTGFEVELMARLAQDLGLGRVLPGPVGQAPASPRLGPDRPGDQRLRMDRAASPRLPGDPAVLRLPVAIDGAARQSDPRPGPT